ncbi:MAG: glycosyltransferase family 39 protein, partial [candidate division NC10 bacterium]|nr:glycosyltransferase family 39 protein [candidate division NC10 bacterium]
MPISSGSWPTTALAWPPRSPPRIGRSSRRSDDAIATQFRISNFEFRIFNFDVRDSTFDIRHSFPCPARGACRVRSYRGLTLLWLLAFAVFHLWFIASGRWPLAPDEAHYWEWSRRLDWSYYSKGPLVAFLIGISTRLGGHTEFWVRLPAVLLGTALAGIAYVLTRRIFQSERAAFLSVVFLSLMPLYAAGSFLMTIDPPFVFFWGLASLCLCHAVRRRSQAAWYGAGIAFGFGL